MNSTSNIAPTRQVSSRYHPGVVPETVQFKGFNFKNNSGETELKITATQKIAIFTKSIAILTKDMEMIDKHFS